MDYKAAIVDGLRELVQTLPADSPVRGDYARLESIVKAENDERRLFMMWQSLRETLAKANDGEDKLDTRFQVKTKEGKVVTYQTLDEMAKDPTLAPT